MSRKASGGCLCGEIRYEAKVRPDTAYYCHCRDCQIGSSSAFTVAIYSDEADFKLMSGEFAVWEKAADSGRPIRRLFCPTCGTPICWTGGGVPGVTLISLSSLDDPEAHTPVHEGWTERALSWCRISDDVESFPGCPNRLAQKK